MPRRSRIRRRAPSTRWADYDGWGFPPRMSAGERRVQAEEALRALRKSGREISPVEIRGREIATSFWGRAWCDNLERYSDYENRLPRGRSYVRGGSVIDLQIGAGRVDALVSGTDLYEVVVNVSRVAAPKWRAIRERCAGGIDSVVELLQGRFSKGVMAHLAAEGTGLFPTPAEIRFSCSCPDSASMCKHVAAVLYGVGARLDPHPELLFRLRQVSEQDLIASAGTGRSFSRTPSAPNRILQDPDLAGLFGVEFAPEVQAPGLPPAAASPKKPRRSRDQSA